MMQIDLCGATVNTGPGVLKLFINQKKEKKY